MLREQSDASYLWDMLDAAQSRPISEIAKRTAGVRVGFGLPAPSVSDDPSLWFDDRQLAVAVAQYVIYDHLQYGGLARLHQPPLGNLVLT